MSTTLQKADQIVDDKALVEEELLDELDDGIPSYIREARLAELKKQAADFQAMREQKHGHYTEISEEKSFFDLTTSAELCVVHFFKDEFRRCSIMDKHMQEIANRVYETKFAKINVENAKFLVVKLKIQVLPTVICFKKGVVCDRLLGFEELDNTDDFSTDQLQQRLSRCGVVPALTKSLNSVLGYQTKAQSACDSDDSDY